MAILERPVRQHRYESTVAGPRRTPDGAAERSPRPRRARRWEVVPIAAIGVLAAVSVGYGFGTLVQFDNDWRRTAPTLVASADGSVAVGTPLASAITELLAGTTSPVSDVRCAADSLVGSADGQLCYARRGAGMVSVLASGPASALHIDVFSGT